MNSTIAILLLRIVEFAKSLSWSPCSSADSDAADDVAVGLAAALLSWRTRTIMEPWSTTMSTVEISEAYGSRNKAKSCDDKITLTRSSELCFDKLAEKSQLCVARATANRNELNESNKPLLIIHEGVQEQHISTLEKILLSPFDLIHIHDHDTAALYQKSEAC